LVTFLCFHAVATRNQTKNIHFLSFFNSQSVSSNHLSSLEAVSSRLAVASSLSLRSLLGRGLGNEPCHDVELRLEKLALSGFFLGNFSVAVSPGWTAVQVKSYQVDMRRLSFSYIDVVTTNIM